MLALGMAAWGGWQVICSYISLTCWRGGGSQDKAKVMLMPDAHHHHKLASLKGLGRHVWVRFLAIIRQKGKCTFSPHQGSL